MQQNLVLDDWQKEVLRTEGHIVLCSGRQTGKSTIISIKASEFVANQPNKEVIVISITEDQSELMLIKILDYLERNHKKLICKGRKKPTKHLIQLTNGSKVRCRPMGATGSSIRGFTADMLIADEAAFMDEQIWTAAKPTLLTTAGTIILVSTPHGRQGYFYECYCNKHNRFKVFHISSEEVILAREISETWTQLKRDEAIRFLEEEKKDMSELQYAQEYLGKFVDDLKQLFPDELIRRCMKAKRPEYYQPGDYYLGVDVARLGGDEITFEIIKAHKERYIHVENIVKEKLLLPQTQQIIEQLNTTWQLAKIGIDAGSGALGVALFDYMNEKPEFYKKVIPMNNRALSFDKRGKKTQKMQKEDFYNNLLAMMQRDEIELLDDESVFLSLKSVQYEYTREDDRPSKVRIFGNYTHIAEGLIRSAWLARKEKVNKYWIDYI